MNSYRIHRMNQNHQSIPNGVYFIEKFASIYCPHLRCNKKALYKASVFVLTYLAYICYHMSRKPISVVKSVLHGNCSHNGLAKVDYAEVDNCGYAPFDKDNAPTLFAYLDSSFLFCYAGGMFISGFIAERTSLRYFLSIGMITSGIYCYLFGAAKTWGIHNYSYFIFVQAFSGLVQTTGWPGVVTLMGRWFGKSKRGLVFGIWNSHTSVGNILGTLIAARYVENDWALSFMMPGFIIAIFGFIVFLFLVDNPEAIAPQTEHRTASNTSHNQDNIPTADGTRETTETTPILHRHSAQRAISIIDALYIPGVIEFSLCLHFSKLVSYTFIYWLPLYIQSSSTLGPKMSADLSTVFDVGGMLGGIVAGIISDATGKSATTCMAMLGTAIPVLLVYQTYGPTSVFLSTCLLLIAGFVVNGPYSLITTFVSAELGQHSSLEGSARALATVTAVIDGTGSIGAAVGPLIAGLIFNFGWQYVFIMLIVANVLAMISLLRLVRKERLRHLTRIRIE